MIRTHHSLQIVNLECVTSCPWHSHLAPRPRPRCAVVVRLCEEDVNYVIAELGLPNTRRRHRQICDMLGGGGGEPAVKKARRDSLQARDPSVFSAEYSDTESYDDTALPPPSSPPQTIAATAERTSVRAAYTRQSLQLSASEARAGNRHCQRRAVTCNFVFEVLTSVLALYLIESSSFGLCCHFITSCRKLLDYYHILQVTSGS